MAKHEKESLDFTYDVFVSFRGEDTRHRFLGYLRNELCRKGIKSFIDDRNMEIGERISYALSKAIEESRIFIVVFSENYASSTWCLDELVKILERSRDKKQRVYPIFYHVDPSDVRSQRDSYGKHMIEHETKFGKESQKVQDWRSALSEVGGLPGKHIKSAGDKYEIDLIEEIVEKVYEYIAPKPLHVGQNPVGLEPRVEEVKSLLDMKLDDVRMLGIYGLGGIGKTELSKALYNNIVREFDAASFLADVREKSNNKSRLEYLQKTLLSEMKEELETELGSTDKGMYEIKQRLRQKKVLLVLDDVDDKDQLEKLAGGRDWFGKGSRIIITTRDKEVLIAHQVEEVYEMTELDEQHCLELFCWNAFKQNQPKEGFENVSLRAVGFAKRLPLALKVIGSDLAAEKTLDDWESVLKDYERNRRNEKIHGVLKTSYDRLGNNPKQVFLDIACFFKGEKKEYVENILDEFGATSNIKVLCRKSLLTIEDGCLKMHDLIQDMGRDIVKQEASNPGERSRLWDFEDVIDTLTEDWGSDKIEGIMLDPPLGEEVDWSGTAFEKMKRLRILIVRNTYLSTEPECLPNHLRVLDWENYPSKSLPSKFHPRKIIVFKLSKSHLTLQEPFKKFSCLTNMDFSHNLSITQMLDVSELQNLRELRLDHCKNLIAVHQTVGFLKRLARLRVLACTKLRIFLQKMFLPSLEVLDLSLCVRLKHFPEIVEEMKNPLKIYMINTAIKELPESIGILTGLVSIDISNSMKLKYLPSSFFMLPNVTSFKSEGCSRLQKSFKSFIQSPSAVNLHSNFRTLCLENGGLSDEDLVAILCRFPKLEELIASENNFVSLPACIKECTNLRVLDVHGCENLEEISGLPSTIQKVDARYCFNLSDKTVDELWFQVMKEIRGLEVVMPATEIPEWFHLVNEGPPHFGIRGKKFPNFAVALVIKNRNGMARQLYFEEGVELQLIINRRLVRSKGYYNFRVAADHVLICDLRLLFSDEEWLGLDGFLEHDQWNLVQVVWYAFPINLTISDWGVFLYQEGTNLEHVQFGSLKPIYWRDMPSPVQVHDTEGHLKRKKISEKSSLGKIFNMTMMVIEGFIKNGNLEGESEEEEEEEEKLYSEIGFLKHLYMEAKDELEPQGSIFQDRKPILASLMNDVLSYTPSDLPEPGNSYPVFQLAQDLSKDGVLGKLKEQGWDIGQPGILYEGKISGLIAAQKDSFDEDTLKWFSSINNNDEVTRHKTSSSSGHKGSDKAQDFDPQLFIIMTKEIFYTGVTDALVEAQKRFPLLDIIKIRRDVLNKRGDQLPIILLSSIPTGYMLSLATEFEAYMSGVFQGLSEAKLSFSGLVVEEIIDVYMGGRILVDI